MIIPQIAKEAGMNPERVGELVGAASAKALECYLQMCRLDSPWEVPEAFLASESAKALANAGLRVAIEFKLDRAKNHPKPEDVKEQPVRLQKAHAKLDIAILNAERDDPWEFYVDGIIEFKKHSSLSDDASLIEFMKSQGSIKYGVLALLIVGSTEQQLADREKQLTHNLTAWQKLAYASSYTQCPTPKDTKVGDRWWAICCLVLP